MCPELQDIESEKVDLQEIPTSPDDIVYDDLSRRDVRSLIFHLLYSVEGFEYQISLETVIDNYNRGFDLSIPLDSEVSRIAQGIIDERDALDEIIKPLLDNWRFERVGVCTKLILRFAIWELEHTVTPPVIVINEAIELAKCFAEKDAYKFVNGILDKLIKSKTESV
ncbi:MAG: transcription antitermination factor NusB [Candidatus Dependentiae bacterium]|nr:transcription antitermination factor NusB [Candidatus Dependentiae bacterium]